MKELLGYWYRLQEEQEERRKSGQVIIQTYNPENFCIEYAKNQNYDDFYNTEIAIRKSLNYPPFCDIIVFGISGADEEEVIKASNKLHNILEKTVGTDSIFVQTKQNINVFAPVSAPISKIKNKHRWRMIIKCKLDNNIIDIINKSLEEYYKLKYKNVTVVVDTNPNNMM